LGCNASNDFSRLNQVIELSFIDAKHFPLEISFGLSPALPFIIEGDMPDLAGYRVYILSGQLIIKKT
jgi:hypothetical protein